MGSQGIFTIKISFGQYSYTCCTSTPLNWMADACGISFPIKSHLGTVSDLQSSHMQSEMLHSEEV